MLITKIYKPSEFNEAAKELRLGELVAFPTETVYGLGADATNEQAVKRVYLAKGRPSDNPLIVTVSSLEMVKRFVPSLSKEVEKIIEKFWPGSLTIVLKIKDGSLSKTVTGGLKTAAFRMPKNETTLNLITALGNPIVGPSANSSGKPSPTTAQHVYHDLEGRIAGILDDGPTDVGVESTIIDMSTEIPTILRPGAVTAEEIEKVIGKELYSDKHKVKENEIPKAPGMKYRHYAPKAPVLLFVGAPDVTARAIEQEMQPHDAVLCFDEYHDFYDDEKGPVRTYGPSCDKQAQGQQLFAALRDLDATSCQRILAQAPRPFGEGLAVSNRIHKAAGFQVVRPAKAQVVGITGTSGSGKSSVGACLQQMGWQIIDADQVYHQLLKLDRNLTRTVLNQFPAVAGPDGTVDRKALSRIVFEDRMELRRLNAITHPAVKREIRRRIRVLTSQGCRRIGLDVPLLYESGLDHVCDFVIGVVAPEPALTERIVRRDGISPEQARIRLASQPDRQFYEALCDILIENDGDEEALCRNLKESLPQMEEAEKK